MGAEHDGEYREEMIGLMHNLRETKAGGIRTSYYEKGTGPALLLLHGMFGDYTDWETVLEPLSLKFRVNAPDLPGFGGSQKPDSAYDEKFFIEWLSAFLQNVNVVDAIVVGNSFGGEIAILYALEHPKVFTKLALVSSGGLRFYTDEERKQIREKFCVENLKALTPSIQEWMFRSIFAEKGEAWQRYLEKQNAKLQRGDHADYAVALHRSMILAFTLFFDEQLRRLRMPVLLVWGDGDIVFPVELAQTALGKLKRGDLVILEGAGHAPQLENSTGFVAAIERFAAL